MTFDFDRKYAAAKGSYYGDLPSPHLIAHRDMIVAAGPTALDAGCGEGRDGAYLVSLGLDVIGVDLADAGLSAAAARGIAVVHADVRALPFASDTFDVVNATTVLDHLSADDVQRAAGEMIRVLRPGGVLLSEVFTVADPGAADHSGRHSLVSETSDAVKHYFRSGELKTCFSALNVHHYVEVSEWDTTHGPAHRHGVARLVACKPENPPER